MDFIKEADFRRELKGTLGAGYLFFGEEDYLKTVALSSLKGVLCPDESFALFNTVSLDALDFSADKLADALMVPPMMAEKKLVTVTGLDFVSMKQSDFDGLVSVLETLDTDGFNVLVISAADGMMPMGTFPKKPSAPLTALAKYLKPVYFARSTPQQLSSWVGRHYGALGVTASAAVCGKTVERCGKDMFMLSSEVDKIASYVRAHGRDTVTEEDVVTASIAAEEFDGFAFANAVLDGKRELALRVLSDMKLRRVEPIPALAEVIRIFCDLVAVRALADEGKTNDEIADLLKIHIFKVGLYRNRAANLSREHLSRMIDACSGADAAMKNGSGQGYRPLETLICAI